MPHKGPYNMPLTTPLQAFVDKGGFKLLAVARLQSGSYALVCYLVNCMAAGVDEVVSSLGELSVLIGIPERSTRTAVEELESCRIVIITRTQGGKKGGKTLAARLNLDPATWQNLRKETTAGKRKRTPLGDAHNVRPLHPQRPHPVHGGIVGAEEEGGSAGTGGTRSDNGSGVSHGLRDVSHEETLSPSDALLFPSGRQGPLRTGKGESQDAPLQGTAVRRVLEAFASKKDAPLDEEKEHAYAALLCEGHPVEQTIALIEAFGREIPSLGLLAGAWMHYSERFHHLEKEEISLEAFRKKSEGLERKLRSLAVGELRRSQSLKVVLSADEELLLRIFTRHDHPRRQLYWALQVRERYPHLQDFFNATAHMAQKSKGRRDS